MPFLTLIFLNILLNINNGTWAFKTAALPLTGLRGNTAEIRHCYWQGRDFI